VKHATPPRNRLAALRIHSVTALLHLLQPIARLLGRVRRGLTPWRSMHFAGLSLPRPRRFAFWSEQWQSPEDSLRAIELAVKKRGAIVHRGGDFDDWDLQIRGGLFGSVRLQMAIEEHGQGRQLMRLRLSPHYSPFGLAVIFLLVALCNGAGFAHAWLACGSMGAMALLLTLCSLQECGASMAVVDSALWQWTGAQDSLKPIPARKVPSPNAGNGRSARPVPSQVDVIGHIAHHGD
jgi:hypothetical protein